MSDLLWLPAKARAAGLDVYEMPGWEDRRTRDGFDPAGVVCHHTATGPGWSDGHVAFLLRDGRRDLAGPLAQIGLERDGTVVLVAAGRANHNGYGLWGNDSIGIEAYNDGVGEPWAAAQMDAYVRLVAVICGHFGWGPDRVKAHRETDPDRKIDPTGIDMDVFRADVFDEGDDMPLNEADKDWLRDLLEIAVGKRQIINVAPRSDVWRWTRESVLGVRSLLGRDPDVDVDEAALAREVVGLLEPSLPGLSDEDLQRIAKAVADENARRQRD